MIKLIKNIKAAGGQNMVKGCIMADVCNIDNASCTWIDSCGTDNASCGWRDECSGYDS